MRVRHASIAPLHVRLRETADGHLVIEAVGEATLRANGRVQRVATLADGDTLELGELAFTVRREGAAPAPADERSRAGPALRGPQAAARRGRSRHARPRGWSAAAGRCSTSKSRRGPACCTPTSRSSPAPTRAVLVVLGLLLAGALAVGIAALVDLFR